MLQNKSAVVAQAIQTAESQQATLAMCPPNFFDVTYQINPWMDLDAWSSNIYAWRKKAHEEWAQLKATYERLGHVVHVITPAVGQPDMVFMANCAAVLNGKALLAHFRHEERQGEEPYYKDFFATLKASGLLSHVENLPAGMAFEGCGDAVWDAARKLFWVGYSQRTSALAPAHVARAFDVEVIPLEMISPRYYHLDVALAPLSGGEIVYLPEAFSAEGLAVIQGRVAPDKLITATQEDADLFAVNLVNIGRDIILSGASPALRGKLTQAGYSLHFVPTEAFKLAGGSVFCLTQRLDHKSG